ncbi:urease accessory UreF family protein [Roseicyclus sp. F158]|uniref:Urease accessory protein UreF n=1 Tax=Tropicimonas omnivorans TaxID=3075590 RepID=A0ABU3DGD1_9RHOB|nr:urease accessory UreF family protein [Roseicyclus sp. F158]MDT0682742.1 urease accessory UreF family protein [Roseicyclus sp. F158]
MKIDALRARLSLVQWLSPAFPIGAFAYSSGLETAVAEGAVGSAADLELWLDGVLRFGSGRQDAALLCAAMAPGADLAGLSALARALAPSAERLKETDEQGEAFARTVTGATGVDSFAAPLPVALGAAAARLGADAQEVAALYLQAFAGTLVSAAIRLVPLGQTEGQRVIARLHGTILAIAAAAPGTDPTAIGSAAFGADLASAAHETLQPRLFLT